VAQNQVRKRPVLPRAIAQEVTAIMTTVVQHGTGTRAAFGQFAAGKTGTTENSADAWFVGFTDRLTVAVWVGYPKGFRPMKTEFAGGPVEGGTFPALIWHDFMVKASQIYKDRQDQARAKQGLPPLPDTTTTTPAAPVTPVTTTPSQTQPTTPQAGGTVAPSAGTSGTGGGTAPPAPTTSTPTPTPAQPAPTTTQPSSTPTPSTGTGGGTGTGGAGGTSAPSG